MTSQLRTGVIAGKPEVKLSGEVECDEVSVTAGHKGNPEAVKKKVVRGGETASKGFGAEAPKRRKNHRFSRGSQRGGEVVIAMLANVQQSTIKPLIKATITPGSLLYTDEYAIYTPVVKWGYEHKTVCHGRGEYARSGRWRWVL